MATIDEHPTDAAPKFRHAERRTSWRRNDRLRVLRMLAWVVYDREGVRNLCALETLVAALCEPVMRIVLAEEGVSKARCN